MPITNLAARAGRWSARHRKTAILGWLAFVIAATLLGGSIGQRTLEDAESGNGESQVADRAVEAAGFPEEAGESVLVQLRSPGAAGRAEQAAAVRDVTARLKAVPHVRDVSAPVASADGRSVKVDFAIAGTDEQTEERVDATLAATAAAQRAHPSVRVEQSGGASIDKGLSKSYEDDFQRAEILSLPVTLGVLILAFGALVAAGLPLLLGLTAVAATLGLVAPLSQVFPVEESISSVVLLIGLAVGVDYAMFYLRREREERAAGRSEEAALQAAAATSGHAVLVSGFTVMVAMAGMFLAGNAVFTSFAWGTILVVAVAMVGSLTVLPAALAALGSKVEKGRIPFLGRRRGESRVWGRILGAVTRRPVLALVASAGVLLALSAPALGLRTITPGIDSLPRDLAVMQTFDRIEAAFPGGGQPAQVVVQADDVDAPAVQAGLRAFEREARASGQVPSALDVTVNDRRDVAIVSVPLRGDGTDAASEAGLAALRDRIIPRTLDDVPGVEANVTGLTAGSKDFNDTMRANLPYVFAFVLGVAFLLLLWTFRSVVVPAKAIVLNLLSVGAAYGVLTLAFPDGIVAWLPLFLFVILFGLSMDYHVFILSRVREAVDGGMSTKDAVAHGVRATAGVVTSAAAVMIAVFAIFATLGAIEFRQMGIGLAVAILIDATIIRGVLLPSAMVLLGERNWWLPAPLRRGRLARPRQVAGATA
jgi:RND superfamily putative drug exporter